MFKNGNVLQNSTQLIGKKDLLVSTFNGRYQMMKNQNTGHNLFIPNLVMTHPSIGGAEQDNETSTISGITNDESTTSDIGLSIIDKKRKIDAIFLSNQWKEEDEYEITKLRQVIRNQIFKHVKFVKGEGAVPLSKRDKKARQIKKLLFGKCHERPDLTKLTGYECQILKMVGLSEDNASLTRRALWWKTYNTYVHQEIRQLRGRMNANLKSSVIEGEKQNICATY